MSAPLEGLRVTVRNGARLATDVFLPAGAGPWPATLVRTPYGKAWLAEEARWQSRDGVAVVVQDCRGRFDSEGRFDLGASDGPDGADTVGWAAGQPWCDGRVASRGFSYTGFTQWRTAVARPPALRCSAAIMAPGWWTPLGFRYGGAVQLAMAAHWLPRQAATDPSCAASLRDTSLSRALEFDQIVNEHRVPIEAALAHPALGRLPLADPWPFPGSELFSEIWRSVFATPPATVGGGASEASGPPERTGVDVPTLVVGGWYDLWAVDATEAFRRLRRGGRPEPHKLVMTPHGHGFDPLREVDLGPHASRFGLDADHRWALEWLTGAAPVLRDLAPVTYFTIGANEWRSAEDWPPPSSRPERIFLESGGGLSGGGLSEEPSPRETSVSFRYDPASPVPTRGGAGIGLPPGPCDQEGLTGGARPDVLSFTGPPLDEPLEITGPVTAELFASSSAPDTDFTVKLIDAGPDGPALSICDGIVRARWRCGPEPVFLRPGRVERFRVHLGVVSYLVAPGHRLRVDVSSSNFPRFDRNPNTGAPEGTDGPDDLRVAEQRVYASRAHPSHVVLPVVR